MTVKILPEADTLELAFANSISRFGDGELRVAKGKNCYGQREHNPKVIAELLSILRTPIAGLTVCLPNYGVGPKKVSWDRYQAREFLDMFGADQMFGSAFITRPDSAPWIDTDAYWARVRQLWHGKDIVLVAGTRKSLTEDRLEGTRSIRLVECPEAEAYREIDRVEEEVGLHTGTVVLCAGVMATCLAARLARKGVHALDLGHIGMFMRHAGAYRFAKDNLASKGYREELQRAHMHAKWGGDGRKHVQAVKEWADALEAGTILDYGCGKGVLAKTMHDNYGRRVTEYDPGIQTKCELPKPADMVVCTDVLEHVEPERLDAVLDHIYALCDRGAYFTIATRAANMALSDGRNAHLIQRPYDWWVEVVENVGFKVIKLEQVRNPANVTAEVRLWLKK